MVVVEGSLAWPIIYTSWKIVSVIFAALGEKSRKSYASLWVKNVLASSFNLIEYSK